LDDFSFDSVSLGICAAGVNLSQHRLGFNRAFGKRLAKKLKTP
jgi:hypothetical protein